MATTSVKVNLTGLTRRLVAEGMLTENSAWNVLRTSAEKKIPLVSYLVQHEHLDPRAVAGIAADEFGVPVLDLDSVDLEDAPVSEMEVDVMERYHMVPLHKRGRKIYVGISDPANIQALAEIRFSTGLTVDAVVVEEDKLVNAIDRIRRGTSGIDELDADAELFEEDTAPATDDPGEIDAPIVRFVNQVLLSAIDKHASDVHFEPYEKFYRIRLRIDGMLHEVAQPPINQAAKLTARIKVMSRLDISERRVPQDGRIKLKLSKNRAIDFRVNTCPTLWGEKVVLRILDSASTKFGIDALGYEPFQKDMYLQALNRPYGMILVTGPTGSGKTVSLYTGVNILNTPDRNICTAEDPVEIQIPGVNQVNIHTKVDLTFASALRAFLRQDPDVILVGEIRDEETAKIAVTAAQTGHLVLSTLHTNDAPKTLTRLVELKVPRYAIATAVNLIIAQRLARKLCEHCKKPQKISNEDLVREGFTEEEVAAGVQVFEPAGCGHCTDGYRGRSGIYEVMPVTDELRRIILMERSNATQIGDQARKEGLWELRRSGLAKVKAGFTSLSELNRVTME
ncbi:MAG: type IV-A pilus assembly ATPase PilB [Gammaproteobacteria bacterium]